MTKLKWLTELNRMRFIHRAVGHAPLCNMWITAPYSDVTDRPSRLVTMAPEEVRADFIAGWLETGTMPYVLTLWPACEPII